MKKVFLCTVLAAFGAAALVSCKKEKKEPKTLIGTWNMSTVDYLEKTNNVVTLDTSVFFAGILSITFNSDKTYTRFTPLFPTDAENGTYETFGSTLVLNYKDDEGAAQSDTAEYEFAEDKFATKETTVDVYDTETVITTMKTNYVRGK
ncbi:MAG TPA: hypothetical protein VL092_12165 [Chitinophagaceae bacterium]|nr:hypothetical protein [Chitinophagaceae bacterium]